MATYIVCDICHIELSCNGVSDPIGEKVDQIESILVPVPMEEPATVELYLTLYIRNISSTPRDICDECVTVLQRAAWGELKMVMKDADLKDGKDWILPI